MSVLQSKFYRIETQLGSLHQRINNTIDSNSRDRNGHIDHPLDHLTTLESIVDQLSIGSRNGSTLHIDRLVDVITKSRDHVRAVAEPSLASDASTSHLNDLAWLVNAKASIHTLSAALKVFSENVLLLDEEINYWEGILGYDWSIGIYALQTSPFRAWRRWMESGANDGHAFTSRRTANDLTFGASSAPSAWPRYYTLVQRYMSTTHSLAGLGILPSLSRLKLEVQSKRKKLKAMRDYNASAVGLLIEECFSFEVDLHAVDNSRSLTNCDLCQRVRANVSLLKVILGNAGVDNATLEHATIFIGSGDNALRGTEHVTDVDPSDPQGIIQELVHILTDLLPRYKQISVEGISAFGRPSPAVRYWLPLSFALVSATTSLKIARNVGPALIESISNFGNTALDFWKNWVVEPMWKLVRTIRHDEASEIALMSKNSLEADRASLERMVVDFVLDRGEQSHSTSSADIIVDKVREGDLTPVLRAYEKDLRSPFLGTVRGDLVRALLIQIQKTKVDVEVAMNGIDALLRSQELVFGFVGLTPGLLISYASIRWFFGLIGNRRGFRLGRRQDVLRYALRKIHCILSKSSLTEEGRLDYRNHGLLICNAEVLLGKARTMLKGEDLRAFREDTSDLIDEDRVDKQLQIIERMAWTYSKWM